MWNVLEAAPHCDEQVCRFLALRGVEGFAPQFPPPRGTRPGSVRDRKQRWVFPGYVFFRVADDFAQRNAIRWAPGVRRVLHFDAGPALVGDDVIELIRHRLSDGSLNQGRPLFAHGQKVVVQSGPLRMVDGIFDCDLDAPARVRVLVRLLGRDLTVAVDPAILKAAS